MVGIKKFFRAGTGAKKIAPVNMKKEEHQFVIDGYLVDEVLRQIPPTLVINQAHVCLIKRGLERRLVVVNELKKHGVTVLREQGTALRGSLICDKISKAGLIGKVKTACKMLNMPYDKAYFKYIVLANDDGAAIFEHCTKEIRPDETDLRKKLRVLGATSGTGKVQSVIQEIGAKKFRCVIKEEPVKLIMCSRE